MIWKRVVRAGMELEGKGSYTLWMCIALPRASKSCVVLKSALCVCTPQVERGRLDDRKKQILSACFLYGFLRAR